MQIHIIINLFFSRETKVYENEQTHGLSVLSCFQSIEIRENLHSFQDKLFEAKMYFLAANGTATVPSLQVLAAAAVPRNCSHYLPQSLQYLPPIVKNAFGISYGKYEFQIMIINIGNYILHIVVIIKHL